MSKLTVTSSPHIFTPRTTRSIMLDVLIALLPAAVASVILFGFSSLMVILTCMAAAVLSELVFNLICKKEQTIGDLSSAVTGLLLALNLPATIPLWQAALGAIFAIVVVKCLFGGIGQNFVNPALLARIILMNSFPVLMTTWYPAGSFGADTTATASPLANIAAGSVDALPSYMDMFIGNIPGCLGETSALALLIGGIYLIARKVISPIIPVTYIGTVFVLSAILGQDPVAQILCGGLFIGAIFMATDYVTSPLTNKGKFIYALCCGIITCLIRVFASLPEGVSYSIVLMNIIVPLIERATVPKPFGTVKEAK